MNKLLIGFMVLGSFSSFANSVDVKCDLYKGVKKLDKTLTLSGGNAGAAIDGAVLDLGDSDKPVTLFAMIPQTDDSVVTGKRIKVAIGNSGDRFYGSDMGRNVNLHAALNDNLDIMLNDRKTMVSVHCYSSNK